MKENINIIFYKLLLVGTVIILFVGSIDKLLSDNSTFKIDRLIISGCNLIKEESIKNQFSFIKNKNIFSLDIDHIKSKITSNEFIASVNIVKVFPSTIILDLIEISPIGLLKVNNTTFLVDNNNSGFQCSSNISNAIHIPEIKSNGDITAENIFSSNEYKVLEHIFSTNQKLFNMVDYIITNNDQIVVNIAKSKIIFDSPHYVEQIDHISKFLDYKNTYNKYKYIKFSHLDVIVKEKDVI